MATMTILMDDNDAELVRKYARFEGVTLSDFARNAILEKIEDTHDMQELRDAIAHGTLRGPFTLGGGDDLQNSCDRLTLGNIGFTVESDSVEEAETIYAALADSGDASMPFAKAPWGDYFGMVIDRFGVGFNITVPASASSLDK